MAGNRRFWPTPTDWIIESVWGDAVGATIPFVEIGVGGASINLNIRHEKSRALVSLAGGGGGLSGGLGIIPVSLSSSTEYTPTYPGRVRSGMMETLPFTVERFVGGLTIIYGAGDLMWGNSSLSLMLFHDSWVPFPLTLLGGARAFAVVGGQGHSIELAGASAGVYVYMIERA